MQSAVTVSGLRKAYGDFVAVDDLDLQIESGEVFAFLGPNGAGKTTTIDILTGAQRRTSGSVSVLGRDPQHDEREWRARIGVVPQGTASYADLTVREVIDHFSAFYPDPFPTGRLIGMVGLGAKATTLTNKLSGGGSVVDSMWLSALSAGPGSSSLTSRPQDSIRRPAGRPGTSCVCSRTRA
ncbi:ATP-binding cassette domain-containing protein [uncultured Propionibacterium sp.]|uniref:ATP-binding cassette domain-containing protein n=1 Tax=uncultured Propionibacterium sp. TaxID=218066 RepID=UPI0037DD23EE